MDLRGSDLPSKKTVFSLLLNVVLDQFALGFSRKKGRQNGQTELTTESASNDQGKNTSAAFFTVTQVRHACASLTLLNNFIYICF